LEQQLATVRCPARVSPAASLVGYNLRSSKPATLAAPRVSSYRQAAALAGCFRV
jgi:hypothetical protein